MKKTIKMLNIILVIIILLSTIVPVILELNEVFATDATVTYNGKVTYGGSTVGNFSVNGIQAFCIDHDKSTPPTGTSVSIETLNDTNIAKCLYYRLEWRKAVEWFYK